MTKESKKIFFLFFTGFIATVGVAVIVNYAARGFEPSDEMPWRTFRPTAGDVYKGLQVMQRNGCFSCHAVRGFGGNIGPELDNAASEKSREELFLWIRDPWEIKPGTRMPTFILSQDEILQIISYLEAVDLMERDE